MTCTTRTGRETVVQEFYNWWTVVLKAWEPESPSNNMQFTHCTTRKPLFRDPYDSIMPRCGSYQFMYIGQPSSLDQHYAYYLYYFFQGKSQRNQKVQSWTFQRVTNHLLHLLRKLALFQQGCVECADMRESVTTFSLPLSPPPLVQCHAFIILSSWTGLQDVPFLPPYIIALLPLKLVVIFFCYGVWHLLETIISF